ncbi:putative spermidine/putrescine transport system substrate-binding protein [Rhodoligotrophos appendicifer]|uniref:ABC transporter substrate-binding protein n=1 Tax=Rhodoligotrophos appendicifer TaxID=987056 RepID=UPI00117CF73E|nr:ABC transporter substrate-binding protein [Rhodoligotrophos appendicifer]
MSKIDRSKLPMTRRTALATLGAATSLLAAPAILRAQTKQIVMANGGGKLGEAYKTAVWDPWTKKTGIEVVATANTAAQLKAMVEQGNTQWDLMQGPAETFIGYGRQGLFEPIDYAVIDKSQLVKDTTYEFFVKTDFAAYCTAWNTQSIKSNPPQNWAELFAISGRIGMWKRPFQTLEATLLADGVPIDQLYPLDLDRAFAALDKIKSKLLLWDTGAQGAQFLIDGEVDAGAIWNGRVQEPKESGAPVDFVFNQAVLISDGWAVPKGAKHKAEAMDLMAYALSAEAQAAFTRKIPYGPVNPAALPLLDDTVKARLPKVGENTVMLSVEYWADNAAKVTERFNTWLQA